jgi:hypothetical protein
MGPWLLAAGLLAAAGSALAAEDVLSHSLQIQLDPASHEITVTDTLRWPAGTAQAGAEFVLNSALALEFSSQPLEQLPGGENAEFFSINGGPMEAATRAALTRYRLTEAPRDDSLTVRYRGEIHEPLSNPKEEYTRGFRETSGLIGEVGVFLGGASFWYPYFGSGLVQFDLTSNVPDQWQLISQGDGTSNDGQGRASWSSGGPMDEIYLVGGPLKRYRAAAGAAAAEVYLHEADDGLAQRYLQATAQYIQMYRQLLGPYPYGKFALVENFWETGYGMPSFTLLGPSIIRFPFILTSSYPHEILHNWWGNSVFVDYPTGNWCEGLTAYLADHLMQEQKGGGAAFRQASLQRFRDFVREGRDFPLTEFRSRHDAATEAVGYGKTLMGFHMLRRQLGDDTFVAALRRFYQTNRGRQASFADLRVAFEQAAKTDLGSFFDTWTGRTGAPELTVTELITTAKDDGYRVTGKLRQAQAADFYPIQVPVLVTSAEGTTRTLVNMNGREAAFSIDVAEAPSALHVDPEFDLFRLLDPRETPPSVGQVFGEASILAVLPAGATNAEQDAYRGLVTAWSTDNHTIRIVMDDELTQLPTDRALWFFGRNNSHVQKLVSDQPGTAVGRAGTVSLAGTEVPDDHSFVALYRHPGNLNKAVGWLALSPGAEQSVAGKLPHYGKYSYLAFKGADAENTLKGQWDVTDSPLTLALGDAGAPPPPQLEARAALAELPAVFDQARLMDHVDFLADPQREGRGVGTQGLAAAADYIATEFAAAGLKPAGDDQGFFQNFSMTGGPEQRELTLRNVIGYLPGTRADWAGQAIVVSAHYDHLGFGWPLDRQANRGRLHPGADDNASGVAVMIELARALAATPPQRSVIFAAFSAEEAGLMGSRHFVANSTPVPLAGVRAVINLDTIGRLGDRELTVLGTGTATEWPHVFRGVSFVTGVNSRSIPDGAEASDQMAFIEQGIPGVQLFTQAHADYHGPGDTADKVDGEGLVRIALFTREALNYLIERPEPLTVTIAGRQSRPAAATGSRRRVSLGTVPEFGYQGSGVQFSEVLADSPAAAAGLKAGDVLVAMDGKPVADLKIYSDLLKTFSPGQTVSLTIQRDGAQQQVEVALAQR